MDGWSKKKKCLCRWQTDFILGFMNNEWLMSSPSAQSTARIYKQYKTMTFWLNAQWKCNLTMPVVQYVPYYKPGITGNTSSQKHMQRFNDKLPFSRNKRTCSSPICGRIRPNISEQLRPSLSLITSLVIMTRIIVGPGRIFPLVKIWVCLRAYRTSHWGWIKSCSLSLDGLPGIPLVAARAWVKWITVGLDCFREIFFSTPQGMRLMLEQQLDLVWNWKEQRFLRNLFSKE